MRKLSLIVLLFLFASVSYAANLDPIPYAQETITVSSTAVSLDSARYGTENPAFQYFAFIVVGTAQIKYTIVDGGGRVNPVENGQNLLLTGYSQIANFRAVRGASTDAVIYVQYWKMPRQ